MTRKSKPGREPRRPPQQVRIIGGEWRGRRLPVLDLPELRPTPDRVRETLFNWLQPTIAGADCLDLFAGTGALGFEAASRGAARVVMIENAIAPARGLVEQAGVLGARNIEIVQRDALAWIADAAPEAFDIVFLDPPFGRGLAERACRDLIEHKRLAEGALIYVETGAGLALEHERLQKFKQGKAGQVQYCLLRFQH